VTYIRNCTFSYCLPPGTSPFNFGKGVCTVADNASMTVEDSSFLYSFNRNGAAVRSIVTVDLLAPHSACVQRAHVHAVVLNHAAV